MVRALVLLATMIMAAATAPDARAADARRGERLAQGHCASCHIVTAA